MKRFALRLAVATFLFSAFGSITTHAQEIAFQAHGTEAIYIPSQAYTEGFGNATHMGGTFGSGFAVPGEDLGGGRLKWEAIGYQFVDKKGDKLFLTGGGEVQFIPIVGNTFFAIWTGQFTVTGGTGKYASYGPADEPLLVTAVNDPFELDENGDPLPGAIWTYDWRMSGRVIRGK